METDPGTAMAKGMARVTAKVKADTETDKGPDKGLDKVLIRHLRQRHIQVRLNISSYSPLNRLWHCSNKPVNVD